MMQLDIDVRRPEEAPTGSLPWLADVLKGSRVTLASNEGKPTASLVIPRELLGKGYDQTVPLARLESKDYGYNSQIGVLRRGSGRGSVPVKVGSVVLTGAAIDLLAEVAEEAAKELARWIADSEEAAGSFGVTLTRES